MKDEPPQVPGAGTPSQSPLHVDKVGNLIVVEPHRRDPEIPEGKGRTCPQCRRTAWRESRFCWNCKYDFDRAELPRCHPQKLLLLSVLVQALVLIVIVVWSINGKPTRIPTSDALGVSPTSVLALAGTLAARLGAFMTDERKVDVTGIWPKRPSADILETKQARQRAAAAPLVSVGQVHGNVITIQGASGLDLSALLAHPRDGVAS